MSEKTRVLTLGGGFAGPYAALEFERRKDPDIEVTLVNRDNFFLFTPMLHEIAASDLDITNIVNPVRKMLRHVDFFAGDVEGINLEKRAVVVSHSFDHHTHTLVYDQLVLALGSITNFFKLPGLEERALTMKSLGDNNEPVKIMRTPLPLVILKALAWVACPWLLVLVKVARCFDNFYG